MLFSLAKSRLFQLDGLVSFLDSTLSTVVSAVSSRLSSQPLSETAMSGVSYLKAGHSNRIKCGNDPINNVDPLGLEPCPPKLFPPFATFVGGADFLGVQDAGREGATSITNASSADFVNALESSDILIYTGHHRDGEIVLSDGKFDPNSLYQQAETLPACVFINGCNSADSLPEPGDFPGTVFIGVDGYIGKLSAIKEANQAYQDLTGDDPYNDLSTNKGPKVPDLEFIGLPPHP